MTGVPKLSLDKQGNFVMSGLALLGMMGIAITGWQMYDELATTEYVDNQIAPIATELLTINKSLNYLAEREARRAVEDLQARVCGNPGNTALQSELNEALRIYRDITGNGFPPSELGCN